jgi:Mrp family chromosome partitioning ATPase/capsular polysaccharide biosynthesis protein
MDMNGEEAETRETPELSDYLRVIRERFWIIPLTVVIVVVVALVVSLTSTPQYRASARLLYQKNNLEQALFGAQVFTSTNQDREVKTGALLVKLEPVAEAVADELGSTRSNSELLAMVSAEPQSTTNVVDILAEGTDPEECADVANAFADQFVLFRQTTDRTTVASARELVDQELKTLSREELASDYGLMLKEKYENLRILESMQNGGFTVVQRATAPGSPFSPQTTRNAIVALVVGLIVGVGLAFLLDYLDRSIKDERTVEKELGAPVLAMVPLVGRRRSGNKNGDHFGEPVGFAKRPALLEAFRTLRSNLEFFGVEQRQSTWLVTSSLPQEGKSTTAVNLGLSLALSGKRVMVLEADLRRPMVHEYLKVNQAPGLSNVLAGTKRLEDALQFVKADEFMPSESRRQPGEERPGLLHRNMYALASGPLPPNPAELLASERMAKLMKGLTGMTDCLVIDTPPALAVSDAQTLARHADGVVLVVRLGMTTRDQLREARDIFARAGARIIGAVAVAGKKSPAYTRKRGYGYNYGYGYGSDAAPPDLSLD